MFCAYGLIRLTWWFRLTSDTPAHGCLSARDHGWHGAPTSLGLRVFGPQARPFGQVCSEHQPSCLTRVSSSVFLEMYMLRLIMGQLGLSLDDETFRRKKLFETTLHLTKFVADSRRVFHKRSFWRPRRLVQGYFCLYLWFCLQIHTIESDDELHR